MFAHLRHCAQSDVGRRRSNNEDAYGAFPSAGIFCVADGMGGGDDGEVASDATVQSVSHLVDGIKAHPGDAYPSDAVATAVESAVNSASRWIFSRAVRRRLNGCGSTFVGVCFDPVRPDTAMALHAGDSRLYRFRNEGLKQITRDHSAAELIGSSDDAINPMFRGMIMRAVGVRQDVEMERTPFSVAEGDRVLLCSDGLTRMVPDEKIREMLSGQSDTENAVHALIEAANAAGGVDNVTVVLVDVGALPNPRDAAAQPPSAIMPTATPEDATSTNPQSGTLTDGGSGESPCFIESSDGVGAEGVPSGASMIKRLVGGIFMHRKSRE